MITPKNIRIKMRLSERMFISCRKGSITKPILRANVAPIVVAKNNPRRNFIPLLYQMLGKNAIITPN